MSKFKIIFISNTSKNRFSIFLILLLISLSLTSEARKHKKQALVANYTSRLPSSSQSSLNVNQEMVAKGYAWDSPYYSKGKYKYLMQEAQKQKLGIWKTTTISPYCYRHKTSKKCIKNKMTME